MPAVTSRRAAFLAVTIVVVLFAAGCGGHATKSSSAATTVAPTSTGPPPLTAKERTWLAAVDKLASKAQKALSGKSTVVITRAQLQSDASRLRGYSQELRRIGTPGGRLQPVSVLTTKARLQFDKGAGCYATAAGAISPGGAVEAGTPQERTFNRSLDCGNAAEGNGLNFLFDASTKGQEIRAQFS
jgi:hypothetical protein